MDNLTKQEKKDLYIVLAIAVIQTILIFIFQYVVY